MTALNLNKPTPPLETTPNRTASHRTASHRLGRTCEIWTLTINAIQDRNGGDTSVTAAATSCQRSLKVWPLEAVLVFGITVMGYELHKCDDQVSLRRVADFGGIRQHRRG
jgi:hypothetical protein